MADPSIGCGGELVDGAAQHATVTSAAEDHGTGSRFAAGKRFCMTDQRDDPLVAELYETADRTAAAG